MLQYITNSNKIGKNMQVMRPTTCCAIFCGTSGPLSLASLSLGHNYLQVVSTAWLYHLTNLTSLLVMDNDISSVEDGALDSLSRLVEINLAGEKLFMFLSVKTRDCSPAIACII